MNIISKIMKTTKRTGVLLLAAIVVLTYLLGVVTTTSATAATPIDVTFAVRQEVESNIDNAASRIFTYRLVALDTAYPMPAGSTAQEYTFTRTGISEADISPITFTQFGVFTYELSVIVESRPGHIYDTRTITIQIHIHNDIENGSFTYYVVAFDGSPDESEKLESIVFYNGYEADTITIYGVKTWEHGSNPVANRPTSITVRVMDGDREVTYAEITAEDNWSWNFVVPSHRPDGTEIVHTITEDPIDDYMTVVNGFNLLNVHPTHLERPNDYIVLEGKKTWDHGANPIPERPYSITVLIMDGNTVVERVRITAADNWRWVAEVPEFDNNGNTINYTVSEENVPRYTLTVNGLNLHNRFVSADFPGDNPITGDTNNVLLWSVLAGGSLVGAPLVIFKRKKKEEPKEV